jgi:predicted NACHT family NTPase
MPFYHALTLGVRRPRPAASKGNRQDIGRRAAPEAWREGLGLAAVEYEEYPAARVLEDFRRAAAAGQARRPWVILGEPGAGKSTLLQRWFDTWAAELLEPRLGLAVPVLVRLRECQA